MYTPPTVLSYLVGSIVMTVGIVLPLFLMLVKNKKALARSDSGVGMNQK